MDLNDILLLAFVIVEIIMFGLIIILALNLRNDE